MAFVKRSAAIALLVYSSLVLMAPAAYAQANCAFRGGPLNETNFEFQVFIMPGDLCTFRYVTPSFGNIVGITGGRETSQARSQRRNAALSFNLG